MDTKEEVKGKMFEANREMALKLQDTEQYLERKLREISAEKQMYLKKLQEVCKHERILEMEDVSAESIAPFFKSLSACRHEENIPCVRVCQICGLMDAQLEKDDRFLFNYFTNERIQRDKLKLEYPSHSHWSVEEYARLKPL